MKIVKALFASLLFVVLATVQTASAQTWVITERIAANSSSPAISGDGGYVAFSSAMSLVPGDTNGYGDVFVFSRKSGTIRRVSVASDGTQGNGTSDHPAISGNGRFVAFRSQANNLVAGDTNGYTDIFVRDMQTGQTERISVASDGSQGNAPSQYGTPSLSADGRFVAFDSYATNLVASDTNGNIGDIFVRDRQNQTTELVSMAAGGVQGNNNCLEPIISADGNSVTFWSDSTNLVTGDTNGLTDVFLYDRQAGTTERVSLTSAGEQVTSEYGNSYPNAISADGNFVAFYSYATDLVADDTNAAADIFVRDRWDETTERVSVAGDGSQANGASTSAGISADGRYVVFSSIASNLAENDTNGNYDIILHDRQTGANQLISLSTEGVQGNSYSQSPSMSPDALRFAFQSAASNLVADDTNGAIDVFVRDLQQGSSVFLPMITR
jgi:Tol biopolymer transport system component